VSARDALRIAIDATSIPPRPAGSGVYAIELVHAMMQRNNRDGYAVFTRGGWFDDPARELRNWRIEHVDAPSRPARLIWEQARLPGALRSLRADVLHSTHHTLPLAPVGCARVVTIHDVTFFRIPARYPPVRREYMQTLTRLSARAADAIIAPSRTAADDIVRTLRVPSERVHVVYEAAAARYTPGDREAAAAVARRYGVEPPYVLSVGSLEPGKNRGRLILAMERLRDDGLPHRLLVIGQEAWKHEGDFQLVRERGMEDRLVFAGYVPDEDMPALYNAAAACACPSLYEGFGLCVIEAMACGTPVLTSDVSATAEVGAGAALLVDPMSVGAIHEGLRRLLTDAALRDDLAGRGIERAREFSWRRAADETHAVYELAAETRRRR
jgi:glycosyltransferase involved in cell wall biosynthesis